MDRAAEDFLASDLLFQEADAFALPLLDFDPDGTLLSPAEQREVSAGHSSDPSSPVSTDGGSTDAEASSPPPQSVQQMHGHRPEMDAAHSPLSSEQKLLAPRPSSTKSVAAARNTLAPPSSAYSTPTKQNISKALTQPTHTPFPGALPYALPVAYFPPLNANQKRPFPQVLPGVTSTGATIATANGNEATTKKSKREIRQMKNRESANKSRLRRKAQLSSLSAEVEELTKQQQELQTTIAGLRAENKSLHDQNAFLRSLVTGFKQEPAGSSNSQLTAIASLPPLDESCVTLSVLESGQKMDVDAEGLDTCADLSLTRPGKQRAVTSTLSTASMAVCASVFGITVFADYDGGAADAGNVRSVGRVLHEASAACGAEGCASGSSSLVETLLSGVGSWWQLVSSSQLVFGVLLNVLSFIAIMAVYQLWQSRSTSGLSWKYRVSSKPRCRGSKRQAMLSLSSSAAGDEKKQQSGSGRDVVRQREKPRTAVSYA